MATYEKVKLSGAAANNSPIDYGTNGSSDTLVHTTGTSSTVLDEVWLWVTSMAPGMILPRLRVGSFPIYEAGTALPEGIHLLLAGYPLSGSGSTGTSIQISDQNNTFTSAYVFGYVNRITP